MIWQDTGVQRSRVVAIDGPAGAGKSTVAAFLAERFGLLNLETGAMYRALALKAFRTGTSVDNAEAVEELTRSTRIALLPGEAGNHVLLDGEDVTADLRSPLVTAAASRVSVFGPVRAHMVEIQRSMGLSAERGAVMEGRDIGTVVFPDAMVKLFLDASVEARGDRRLAQQPEAAASRAALLSELEDRDRRDRSRQESPLRPAPDAIRMDTTGMSLEEVLTRVEKIVAEHLEV